MRLVIVVLAVALLQLPQAAPPPSDQLYARFSAYLDALRIQGRMPGLAAAIVGDTDILWEGAYGQSNVEQSIAMSPDTAFHFDALTQVFTAAMTLRCVEEGKLSLEDPVSKFEQDVPDGNATIRQVLSHTSGVPGQLIYAYRLERFDPLKSAVRACTGDSFRETLSNLLDRLAMIDSVPGPDVVTLVPPAEGVPTPETAARYLGVLSRLTGSYATSFDGSVARSIHPDTTLTPTAGLISTARDYAKFDVALKGGFILLPETLAAAWQAPIGGTGQPLPHGLGWFVQTYNGEPVVWQFGMSENASSSLVIMLPLRRLTLVLLANSDGLVKPFALSAGDVTTSPFARVFLGLLIP